MHSKALLSALLCVLCVPTLRAQDAQPSRRQLEAQIAQMPRIPTTAQVRIGHLDNGLTYYIRPNTHPKGRAEFYLATNVGAIQERQPEQDGLAHFLEHMCFNGTEHFPGKGILEYLRSIGAEFGANINASTGLEETQYLLSDIPVEREGVVDTCLMILRDYAHHVLNLPEEVDKERGVIIEERRTRRNASWRLFEKSLPVWFAGTPMAQCTLIGTQEHLETFSPESLKAFYTTWYHPGNQAVVVVGDIDPDRTEARLRELFSAIPRKENPERKTRCTLPAHAEPRLAVLTDPEATLPSIDLVWHSDALPEGIHATLVGRASRLIQSLVSSIMDERLDDMAKAPDAPFLEAGLSFGSLLYEDIDAIEGEVSLKEDNLLEGFRAFYTEIVRLGRHGVTQDEFDRAKAKYLAALEAQEKKADTRRNAEFIGPILSHFFDQFPLVEPAEERQLAETLLAQLGPGTLTQTVSHLFGPENRIIIYSGPEKAGMATPKEEDLLRVMAEVEQADIPAPAGAAVPGQLLDPAKIKDGKVSKTAETLYGAQEWTLSNGLTVVVYPTRHTQDQILLRLSRDGGLSLVETEDLPTFQPAILSSYFQQSGLGAFDASTLEKILAGKHASAMPFFDALEHGISARSTRKDLETALALMHLIIKQPRKDAKAWETAMGQLRAVLPGLMAKPSYKFQKAVVDTLYGGNPRVQLLSQELLEKASLETLDSYFGRMMGNVAGARLVVVGDVAPDSLRPLALKYMGSLPGKGKKPTRWIDRHTGVPPGVRTHVFQTAMETPKSSVLHCHSTREVAFDHNLAAALEAVAYILDMRYTESLREQEGGTYGAGVTPQLSRLPHPEMRLTIWYDCNPSLCAKLRQLTQDTLEDLLQNGPTAKEVEAARLNQVKQLAEKREQNGYWMDALQTGLRHGEDPDALRAKAVESVTAERIHEALGLLMQGKNFVEVVMEPAAAMGESSTAGSDE